MFVQSAVALHQERKFASGAIGLNLLQLNSKMVSCTYEIILASICLVLAPAF